MLAKSAVNENPRSPLSTWVISLFLAGIIISAAYLWWRYESEFPRTDDAEITAIPVWIAPQVSGVVTDVRVRPDQKVKTGEILLEIDQKPTGPALDEAKEKARIQSSGAEAIHAKLKSGIVAATVDMEGHQKVENAAARDEGDRAAQRLERTVVRAPLDGSVTNINLKLGDYVKAGDRLLSLVKFGGWFVKASFSEDRLNHVRPGMPAEVKVESYHGITFVGVVTDIESASASSSSPPPPQNAGGDQESLRRNTVYVHLPTADPERPFRLGASCQVEVNIRAEPTEDPGERYAPEATPKTP